MLLSNKIIYLIIVMFINNKTFIPIIIAKMVNFIMNIQVNVINNTNQIILKQHFFTDRAEGLYVLI